MVPLGVLLHAIGGFAAGTFYLPLRAIRGWSWESGWLINGIFSWLIAPLVVAWLVVPDLPAFLSAIPPATLGWTYLFGVLWGIGGLTFGLSCRYLGMSLGYAVALGFCAFFGTIVPPIYAGTLGTMLGELPGLVLLAGLGVCLLGIAICLFVWFVLPAQAGLSPQGRHCLALSLLAVVWWARDVATSRRIDWRFQYAVGLAVVALLGAATLRQIPPTNKPGGYLCI